MTQPCCPRHPQPHPLRRECDPGSNPRSATEQQGVLATLTLRASVSKSVQWDDDVGWRAGSYKNVQHGVNQISGRLYYKGLVGSCSGGKHLVEKRVPLTYDEPSVSALSWQGDKMLRTP